MKARKWTKKGLEIRKAMPQLFSASTGHNPAGSTRVHTRDSDFNRARNRADERNARYGRYED